MYWGVYVSNFKAWSRELIRDESGQDLIEYALVAALIGLGCIAGVKTLSSQINNVFNSLPQLFINAIYS